MSPTPVLEIHDFSLTLRGSDGRTLPVLQDIRLRLDAGRSLGIAGESGSGKSVLALSMMGLLDGDVVARREGTILFQGRDLAGLTESEWRPLRGRHLAMVFQEPMTAMNPLLTLREQVAELVTAHHPRESGSAMDSRIHQALHKAGFAEPERFLDSFPHQLSGGMRQRAMLAMAMVLEPEVIIADEPTTALDAALQVQLLAELRREVQERGRSLVFISHDLGVIRAVADELAILYAGHLVELGPAAVVLEHPAHPYAVALLEALPRLSQQKRLPLPIPGHLPPPDRRPVGCVFADRCRIVREHCRTAMPPYQELSPGRLVRCFYPVDFPGWEKSV